MRKDFEVTIKLRNNQLKSRRTELGLSILELCKRVHISVPTYIALEGLKVSPVGRRSGDWRPAALKLADYFRCSPEDLFPDAVRLVCKNTIVAEFDLTQLPQAAVAQASAMLPSPESEYIVAETKQQLHTALDTLPPRDAEIVRLRYGLADGEEHELADIGARFGVCKERVRQIVHSAISQLREVETLKDCVPPRERQDREEVERLEARASSWEREAETIQYTLETYHLGNLYESRQREYRRQLCFAARKARDEAKRLRELWGL